MPTIGQTDGLDQEAQTPAGFNAPDEKYPPPGPCCSNGPARPLGRMMPSAAEYRETVVNRESPDAALFGARKVALAMAVASAES